MIKKDFKKLLGEVKVEMIDEFKSIMKKHNCSFPEAVERRWRAGMDKQRYLAIVSKDRMSGYALDYFPEEKDACYREYKNNIIGDFGTYDEANNAVVEELRKK